MPAPENRFKTALAAGTRLYGCWAGFADPYPTEVLASAGFDWLLIDGEHAPNDLRTIMAQLQVLDGTGSAPVVRLPMGETWAIKQVLDAGAQTLLIPMVETAEEAGKLARAMRYPPGGNRGSGAALARASGFSGLADYTITANDQMCLLVQVETCRGVDALDDILGVDGVDGVFIGPSDLACDMGYPSQSGHPAVQEVIEDCLRRIAASDKAAGTLATDTATAEQYRDWGAQFLAVGIDVLLFAEAARALRARWPADG